MEIVEIFKAILFGLVEGITEWLPISSTGHLILLDEFVSLNESDAFKSMFDVVIQLGAVLAVVVIYWSRLWPFGKKNNEKPLSSNGFGAYVKTDIFVMWFKVLVSCIPAIIVGVTLDDWFEEHFYNPTCVSIALIVFGVAFIVVEKLNEKKALAAGTGKGISKINSIGEITYRTAFIIGLFQLLAAVFPGTSRSGATIIGALVIGVSRKVAAEYTFFLAVPVMFGASLLKIFKFSESLTASQGVILFVAMVTAFLISLIVIKLLIGYIKKHNFVVFGWYRIVLGILVILYFAVLK